MTDLPPEESTAPNEVLFWRDQKIKMQAERDAIRSELAAERRRKEFWKANYHTPVAERDALRERIETLAAAVRESEGGGLYVGPDDILALLGGDE